ncbi:MAG: hypothetical protein WBV45_11265 [Lutimonas sp.]
MVFPRRQVAREEPEMFIHGPKTAGASRESGILITPEKSLRLIAVPIPNMIIMSSGMISDFMFRPPISVNDRG